MTGIDLPKYPTRHGYMSERIQEAYIKSAVAKGLLPPEAHRMPEVVSLTAPSDLSKPIQFWQLYSILGQDPIVGIVSRFYERGLADEPWFLSVFEQVGGLKHHIVTQASMWIDVMGGGPYYHGGEYRLSFHHTHNAMALMNDKGGRALGDPHASDTGRICRFDDRGCACAQKHQHVPRFLHDQIRRRICFCGSPHFW